MAKRRRRARKSAAKPLTRAQKNRMMKQIVAAEQDLKTLGATVKSLSRAAQAVNFCETFRGARARRRRRG